MTISAKGLLVAACGVAFIAAQPTWAAPSGVIHPRMWPRAASPAAITDAATEARIDSLMAHMSLDEKVGQTIQADIDSIAPDDLRHYPLGSLLAGGSAGPHHDNRAPAAEWVALIGRFRAVATEVRTGHTPIPLIFGIDAVHGHNKIVGATLFPHNIGLGAARDPALIRRIGAVVAQEVKATGADWTFAPTVAVPRDIRWGRSYEGYAEDPEVVAGYAGPMTLGLQGVLAAGQNLGPDHIMGSAKHFLADGGTDGGVDQGDARVTESELIRLHVQGYRPAIDAGILGVMVSFSSWNGVKNTGNFGLITDVLKGRMGFKGFVVGDWNAHGQVPGCDNSDCPQALNAGLDMFMAPDGWKALFENTLAEAKSGRIPAARLNDAVRRILRVKIKAGLFDAPSPLVGRFDLLGSPEHRAVARQAVRESLVLLKNDGVLPIKASARVLVTGDGADDIGKQSGGWTLNWQGVGNHNRDFPHGQSIYGAIADALAAGGGEAELAVDGQYSRKPDVAVVVFGENPYAEFQGDITTLEFQPGDHRDLRLLRNLQAQGIPVVAVFLSGRPLWTNPHINASNAFVAAWLPGTEGGGIADVLVGDRAGAPRHDFSGRLSYSWPKRADRLPGHREERGYDPQFAYGYGLTYARPATLGVLSEDPGRRTADVNLERYFVAGHAPPPWTLSTSGALTTRPVDAGAQENAIRADWRGGGEGILAITGGPVDLSRQTTGDMTLRLRLRVQSPPDGPVRLTAACGIGCGGSLDITSLLATSIVDTWQDWKIRLSCFRNAGTDMAKLTSPFTLNTAGRLSLTFREIALAPNDGDSVCPAAVGQKGSNSR